VIGFGYNPYFNNGWTLGIEMRMALEVQQKLVIDITAANNQTTIASADLVF